MTNTLNLSTNPVKYEKSYLSQIIPKKVDKSRLLVLRGDIDDFGLDQTGINSPGAGNEGTRSPVLIEKEVSKTQISQTKRKTSQNNSIIKVNKMKESSPE